jgi:anti-sigma factor RsiW
MNVNDDDLTAFADGELAGAEAVRVAAAIAADPALAVRIEAERRLRTTLRAHLDPIAAEPVPESLSLLIAAVAADESERDMTDAPETAPPPPTPARVLDFAAARARREAQAKVKAASRPAPGNPPRRWGTGAAIAASLVLGLVLGTQFARPGAVTERDGALVASGALAQGLDMQLASAGGDSDGGGLRILASFQRDGGGYCRVFDGGAMAGIACKDQGAWRLERTVAGERATGTRERAGTAYRQAGSAQGDLLAAAQAMTAGDPLDATQERAARVRNWAK